MRRHEAKRSDRSVGGLPAPVCLPAHSCQQAECIKRRVDARRPSVVVSRGLNLDE